MSMQSRILEPPSASSVAAPAPAAAARGVTLSLLSMTLDPICADAPTSKHRRTDTDGISIVLESFVVPSPFVKEAANVIERRRCFAKRRHEQQLKFSFIYILGRPNASRLEAGV